MSIAIEITAAGGVRMLHDDAVDLGQLGEVEVSRASHVEFSSGKPDRTDLFVFGSSVVPERGWYVQSAKTLEFLATGFPTRAEALAWEKAHYSPTGAGWAELTGGKA